MADRFWTTLGGSHAGRTRDLGLHLVEFFDELLWAYAARIRIARLNLRRASSVRSVGQIGRRRLVADHSPSPV